MAENNNFPDANQGVINKCPGCGGPLKAFASRCELCGHELAGVRANKTVAGLVEKFNEAESQLTAAGMTGGKLEKELIARKGRIIRDFPIPNARDDLLSLIHFIHPRVQDNIKPDPNQEDWRVKFKEVLSLARNAYKGDAKVRAEFEELERGLNVTLSGALQGQVKRSPIMAIALAIVAVLAVGGIAMTQLDGLKKRQCEEQYEKGASGEKARLDGIVAALNAKQKNKNFAEARTLLGGLRWDYQETCKTDEAAKEKAAWDVRRKELESELQKAEVADKASQDEAARRQAEEKRIAEEKALAAQLADKARAASSSRKAATNKEW